MPFAMSAAPAGWLACDGSSQLIASFSVLSAAIRSTFGGVDLTHFNLPDLRDDFIRGANGATRVVGARESWATAAPQNTSPLKLKGDGTTTNTLVHYDGNPITNPYPCHSGFIRVSKTGEAVTTGSAESNGSGTEADLFNVVVGDAETRPRNVALLYCIKT